MAATACPHCGHESEAGVCPLCGSEMPGAGDGPPGSRTAESGAGDRREAAAGRAAAAASPEGPGPIPWEDPGVGFPADAWRTWRGSLLEPAGFFRRIDHGGPMARPILYFLLVSVLGGFFHLLWQAYLYLPMAGDEATVGGGLYVAQFFATPFAALFFLAIQTLVLHLFVLMLAPEHRGFGSTARVICYASGPVVLSVVPFVGTLAGGIWSLILEVVGIREVHRTTTGRAVVVALAPVILAFGLAVVLFVLLALTLGRGQLASSASLPLPLP